MSASVAPKSPQPASTRHFFGIREPGRLVVAMFRLPLHLYRRGWGPLLGHTFLVFVHVGRKTGSPHETTAMVLRFDSTTDEAIICLGMGTERRLGTEPPCSPGTKGRDRPRVLRPSTGSSPRTRPSPPASSSAVSTHGDSASSRRCSVGRPAIRFGHSRVRACQALRRAQPQPEGKRRRYFPHPQRGVKPGGLRRSRLRERCAVRR